MSAKPGTVCTLQTGKVIDSQNGFVATWNWLVDWVCNLKGEDESDSDGAWIEIDNSTSDHPVIKVKGGGRGIVAGDDTNLEVEEAEENGKKVYKIDVYYK